MEPPTLGAALLRNSWAGTDLWLYPELITVSIVHGDGVTTIIMFGSYLIYWTQCNHQYGLRLEDVYLELNAFPDRDLLISSRLR